MTDNSNTCVIFAAGEYYSDTPIVPSGAFIIAADGGLDHARALDMSPDVVVGDFDRLLENVRHRVNTPLPYLQKKTIQTFCRH